MRNRTGAAELDAYLEDKQNGRHHTHTHRQTHKHTGVGILQSCSATKMYATSGAGRTRASNVIIPILCKKTKTVWDRIRALFLII